MMVEQDTRLGVGYMLISVVGFAVMNLVVKFLGHIPPTELVLFRSIISLFLSLIMIYRKGISPFGNNRKYLILRGIFGVSALSLFFTTLQDLPLASAITIQYLSPIFTAFFAIFILKEPMRPIQWVFFLVSFLGIALIKVFDPNITPWLFLAGIASAVFSGLAYNMIGKLRNSDDPVVVVFYFPLIATPIMAVISIFYWVTPVGWDWLLLILMGVLTQIAQVYMTKAYQVSTVNKVAGLKYFGIIFALSFDFFIFGVEYQWLALVGIVLVVAGVILNILHKSAFKQ
ncbi:MAG: DMT family transporter [Bacteroidota bacterium]|nr:DMT family transporter [Bacteroidota bacterium]